MDYLDDVREKFTYRTARCLDHSSTDYASIKQAKIHWDTLKKLATHIHGLLPDIKLMVTGDYVYLYTNNPESLGWFHDRPELSRQSYRQVVVDRQPGAITLRSSDYCYRTYFKNRHVDAGTRDILVNFFHNNRDSVRMGPGFQRWVVGDMRGYRHQWLESYFFFDHNDRGETTMLNLARPGLIRQTLPIVVVNN